MTSPETNVTFETITADIKNLTNFGDLSENSKAIDLIYNNLVKYLKVNKIVPGTGSKGATDSAGFKDMHKAISSAPYFVDKLQAVANIFNLTPGAELTKDQIKLIQADPKLYGSEMFSSTLSKNTINASRNIFKAFVKGDDIAVEKAVTSLFNNKGINKDERELIAFMFSKDRPEFLQFSFAQELKPEENITAIVNILNHKPILPAIHSSFPSSDVVANRLVDLSQEDRFKHIADNAEYKKKILGAINIDPESKEAKDWSSNTPVIFQSSLPTGSEGNNTRIMTPHNPSRAFAQEFVQNMLVGGSAIFGGYAGYSATAPVGMTRVIGKGPATFSAGALAGLGAYLIVDSIKSNFTKEDTILSKLTDGALSGPTSAMVGSLAGGSALVAAHSVVTASNPINNRAPSWANVRNLLKPVGKFGLASIGLMAIDALISNTSTGKEIGNYVNDLFGPSTSALINSENNAISELSLILTQEQYADKDTINDFLVTRGVNATTFKQFSDGLASLKLNDSELASSDNMKTLLESKVPDSVKIMYLQHIVDKDYGFKLNETASTGVIINALQTASKSGLDIKEPFDKFVTMNSKPVFSMQNLRNAIDGKGTLDRREFTPAQQKWLDEESSKNRVASLFTPESLTVATGGALMGTAIGASSGTASALKKLSLGASGGILGAAFGIVVAAAYNPKVSAGIKDGIKAKFGEGYAEIFDTAILSNKNAVLGTVGATGSKLLTGTATLKGVAKAGLLGSAVGVIADSYQQGDTFKGNMQATGLTAGGILGALSTPVGGSVLSRFGLAGVAGMLIATVVTNESLRKKVSDTLPTDLKLPSLGLVDVKAIKENISKFSGIIDTELKREESANKTGVSFNFKPDESFSDDRKQRDFIDKFVIISKETKDFGTAHAERILESLDASLTNPLTQGIIRFSNPEFVQQITDSSEMNADTKGYLLYALAKAESKVDDIKDFEGGINEKQARVAYRRDFDESVYVLKKARQPVSQYSKLFIKPDPEMTFTEGVGEFFLGKRVERKNELRELFSDTYAIWNILEDIRKDPIEKAPSKENLIEKAPSKENLIEKAPSKENLIEANTTL